MSFTSPSSRLLQTAVAAALLVATGCDSNPSGPADSETAELELALEEMAAEANGAGDPDAALAFNDGLSGVRFGVRPTEISVQVGDEVVRYKALVVGVLVRHDGTRELVRRSLIAWTGERRPTAILHDTSFSDEAEFSFPSDLATRADVDGLARGSWMNLVRGHRYVATSGPVSIVADATDEECPSVPAAAPFNCVKASWDIRLEGAFKPLPRRDARQASDVPALMISTSADDVNGVVLSRKP